MVTLSVFVPQYFQSTNKASNAVAGAYLIPAFAGNTAGGLLAGYWIKKTGLYKWPTVLTPLLSIGCMLLCLLTWNGNTSLAGSLAIFPGGLAMGMVTISAFVGLAASADENDVAVTASGMYLFFNIGGVAGASAGTAAYQAGLESSLRRALKGVDNQEEVSWSFRFRPGPY